MPRVPGPWPTPVLGRGRHLGQALIHAWACRTSQSHVVQPPLLPISQGVLSGPGTNTKTLMTILESARFGTEATAVLMLYSCSGAGDKFCVTAQPYFSETGQMVGTLLELSPCTALNLKVRVYDGVHACKCVYVCLIHLMHSARDSARMCYNLHVVRHVAVPV